jgi:hypothetical protein
MNAPEGADCRDVLTCEEEAALAVIRGARAELEIRRVEPTLEALAGVLTEAGAAETGSAGPGRTFRFRGARFSVRVHPGDSALIDVSFGGEG